MFDFLKKSSKDQEPVPVEKRLTKTTVYYNNGIENLSVCNHDPRLQQFYYYPAGGDLIFRFKNDIHTTIIPEHRILYVEREVRDDYYTNDLR